MDHSEKWPGATSNRFPSSRKVICTRYSGISSEFQSPPNGLLAYASASAERLSTRKHFEEKFGVAAAERKLCFRKAAKSLTLERNRSLRHIEPKFTERKPRPEKLHVRQELPLSTRPEMPLHMHMVRGEDGTRPQDRASLDFDFHKTQMGRKAHVEDPRNGFPLLNPGEKNYAVVEYAPEFFKHEGIYPSSTYRLRVPRADKTAAGVFQTLQSYDASKPNRVKWTERLKRVASDEMTSDVKYLLEWYRLRRERTVLKDIYPSLPDPDETDEERPVQ